MKKLLVSLALILLVTPVLAFAAEFRTNDSLATVKKDENPTNLYIASQTVNVDGNVNKDLVVAGSTLNINGNVQNSLIAAGGTLNLNGKVGNNARLAGGSLNISGTVEGDVTAGGGTVTVDSGAVINGDLMVAGGNLTMDGKVGGSIYLAGGNATINGTVGGVIKANVGKLTFGDKAVVNGKVTYWSQNEAQISGTADLKAGTDYHKQAKVNVDWQGFWYFGILMKTVFWLVTLFILVYLMPRFARNFTNETYRNVWKNLGWGLLALFVAPIILILILITVVGIPLAFILGLFWILLLALAGILSPLVIGALIYKFVGRKDEKYVADWRTILIGVAAVFVLQLLPFVGWFVLFVFFLIALGELTLTGWGVVRKQRT